MSSSDLRVPTHLRLFPVSRARSTAVSFANHADAQYPYHREIEASKPHPGHRCPRVRKLDIAVLASTTMRRTAYLQIRPCDPMRVLASTYIFVGDVQRCSSPACARACPIAPVIVFPRHPVDASTHAAALIRSRRVPLVYALPYTVYGRELGDLYVQRARTARADPYSRSHRIRYGLAGREEGEGPPSNPVCAVRFFIRADAVRLWAAAARMRVLQLPTTSVRRLAAPSASPDLNHPLPCPPRSAHADNSPLKSISTPRGQGKWKTYVSRSCSSTSHTLSAYPTTLAVHLARLARVPHAAPRAPISTSPAPHSPVDPRPSLSTLPHLPLAACAETRSHDREGGEGRDDGRLAVLMLVRVPPTAVFHPPMFSTSRHPRTRCPRPRTSRPTPHATRTSTPRALPAPTSHRISAPLRLTAILYSSLPSRLAQISPRLPLRMSDIGNRPNLTPCRSPVSLAHQPSHFP
ncbi:hypothetical protein B0H16DRAFT_1840632 [Mycena metata]|uniref:Uncharacterized protein n=1 Tax=Mycena metata TaxID=1033252 RepID=A0AAD7N9F1_9AGAR|nr:hypothetical protein B0H16DRAFT_1840632 [Mycena metata]